MSDFRSKLPSMDEVMTMSRRFYHDMKTSVNHIAADYRAKRNAEENLDVAPPKKTKATKKTSGDHSE